MDLSNVKHNPSEIYIMSQILESDLRIDTISSVCAKTLYTQRMEVDWCTPGS